ncbi:MAG TPA: single-stranded-DNA-specific exonuclease RecJ, partial [Planctomycetota bacterium]|nr:single-stranded-DNA-specific exonuclease RecJ [Planctomycetota bacterium]
MSVRPARRRNPNMVWAFATALDAEQSRAAALLAQALRCSPAIARILVRRGYTTPQEVHVFRQRRMDSLLDPDLLPDMALAVARIAEAIEKKQSILLFGDYDVDGISATALLARFLKLVQQRKPGFKVTARVPERRHGYGLSPEAVRQIRELKPDLVVTLDNGSTSHAAVDALNADGIDSVIVDHHTLEAKLPAAHAVINPKREDSTYGFRELCGAALSFKLAWALAKHFSHDRRVTPEFKAFLLDAMALAATGTIADVVPLRGENRVLAWHGLDALSKTKLPGLRALMQVAQIEGLPTATDISFRIGPRINAAGRCADAAHALDLLLTDDPQRATELAARLNDCNTERQAIESRMLEEARAQAQARIANDPQCRGLVLHSKEWQHGLVGIVAARMVEEFNRPSLLLALNAETGVAQGSGRSIRGLNLHSAMAEHRALF